MQKSLEPDSEYNEYDMDGDGIVTDSELAHMKEIKELEMAERKQTQQRKMAWVALGSMLLFTIFVFMPFVPESRLKLLGDISGLFYIAMAGVVGAYMGMTAYMSRK